MVNLYQILNISPHASNAQIQAALMRYQQQPNADAKIVQAAHVWLLNDEVRPRYDAKLRAEFPDFFAAGATPKSTANTSKSSAKTIRIAKPNHQKNLADDELPYLWNPNSAALWSILFSPIFGAWLHMLNWRELGNEEMAKQNKMWVITLPIASIVLIILDVALDGKLPSTLGISLILIWYFTLGKKQVELVKNELNNEYEKRGWLKPILLAIVSMVAFYIFLFVVYLVAAVLLGKVPQS